MKDASEQTMKLSFRYRKRKAADRFFTAFACISAALGVGFLLIILSNVFVEGLGAIDLNTFIKTMPSPGESGGLINAIIGSLMMSGLAMLVAVPVGIMGGVYLAEYARHSKIAGFVQFLNDILLSAPSICFGLFAYEIMVVPMHGFSGYAGAVALAFIAIPIILRTTEDMLSLVPDQFREAAAALGAHQWRVIFSICFRFARPGIVTGLLLAFARIVGETAPLLFTALNNQFWNLSMIGPTPNLPVTIYQLAMSPYSDWHRLAWAGAMIITLAVLAINVATRFMTKDTIRKGF